ncbi:glutamate--tRNA ligase [Candidatus Solincola tengchongensis]|uniref:glutamate--tRNA ligase n=1 Tax=Candidatus Solincola tengchongensis TaxID=2900693 RepID=UPI0025795D5D|nr:glutamate--tRNA ligase [Candidatus Solincola tengchongensis]
MVRVRFAPSPTGRLHLGSARTALFNWLFARGQGGSFILRIEDTDVERSSREMEESILEDLKWLGLDWDEGPDVGGPHAPYRQSERGEVYREHARLLVEKGMAYPCFCTPEQLEEKRERALAEGQSPRYDGACRDLEPLEVRKREGRGERPALRFRLPEKEVVFQDLLHGLVRFPPGSFGDFIIMRSDGRAGFHFSVVVDDAVMGITHVIRGEDHLTNTARHVLLFEALGYPAPMYLHHSLLLGPDGGKMSKRHGATSVREYREMGYLPQALANYLALLSWSPPEGREVLDLSELVELFDIGDLSRSPAVFDRERLDWLNGKHLRRMPLDELVRVAGVYAPRWSGHPLFAVMLESVLDNITNLGELPSYLEAYGEPARPGERAAEWLRGEVAGRVLEKAEEILREEGIRDLEHAHHLVARLRHAFDERDLKPREILMPLRVALTGRDRGPALPYLLYVLGRDECLRRLQGVRS